MDYRPNIDAVEWFARELLPTLRQRLPAVCFRLVAAAPTSEMQAPAELPGVHVTRRVPDTRPYLAAADLIVTLAPDRAWHPEQAARSDDNGTPGGATPEAFQGVRVEPGLDILLTSGE